MLRIQKASAGSGKTFTLTRQYITMLLGERDSNGKMRLYGAKSYGFLKPKPHGRILAITFTNKATQEMTERIVQELARLANPAKRHESDHLQHLCEVFGVTEDEIGRAASTALADLLFNFSYFNVSTIDSFFQSVLRIFTRELDLPPVVNLEVDDKYIVAVAIGELLGSINREEGGSSNTQETVRRARIKDWLTSYMEALLDNGTNANIFARSSKINRELGRTISAMRGEDFKIHSADILDYISDPSRLTRFSMGLATGPLKDPVTGAPRPKNAMDVMRENLQKLSKQFLSLADAAYLPKTLRESYLLRWANDDFSYTPIGRDTVPKALAPDGKRHNKLPKNVEWSATVDDALVRILSLGMDYFSRLVFYDILRRQIYLMGLFSEICRNIEDYCRENDAFLLGDTNALLRKVICESETPFVYERLGYVINHFLIDEFQDTSEMQWDNLAPLVIESMSRDNDNLIIGDEKQCIYRFRNSKPELLGNQVEDQITDRFGHDSVTIAGNSVKENTNWRSSRNVVMFNNTLFAALACMVDSGMATGYATATFSGIVQQVAPKNRDYDGYVKIIFGPSEPFIPDLSSLQPDEVPPKGYGLWTNDDVLRHMGEEIDRQLSAGYSPRDIAILVRAHTEGQAVISYLLDLMKDPEWKHGHIDIISSDALEIGSSPSVQLILGILRLATTPQYIVDPEKTGEDGQPVMKPNPEYLRNRLIHRYEISVFDRVAVTDQEGNQMTDEDGNPVMRNIHPHEALTKSITATRSFPGEESSDHLQQEIDKAVLEIAGGNDTPGLFPVVERIIATCIPAESRRNDVSFLSAFQDLVMEYEERGNSDIKGFLDWWDDRGRFNTLSAPDGMDALKVMTIHQAKGLEFHCVHVPFCNDKLIDLRGTQWYQLDRKGFPGIYPDDVPPFIPLVHSSSFNNIPMIAEQYQRIRQMSAIDTLNVTYVAFTRAKSELIVYAQINGSKSDTVASTLLDGISEVDETRIEGMSRIFPDREWMLPLAPGLRNGVDGEKIYELGSPTLFRPEKDQKKDKNEEEEKISKFPEDTLFYAGDSGRPKSFDAEIPYDDVMKEYTVERPAGMTLPADPERDLFDVNDERQMGIFLHDVLAHVGHISELPLWMERVSYRFGVPREVSDRMLLHLQKALAREEIAPWFEDYVTLMNERPLTASEGLRRPDRVVVMPDGSTVVIDYKFGKPHTKYRDQVVDYIILLRQCGYSNVSGYLFFPLTGNLIKVKL